VSNKTYLDYKEESGVSFLWFVSLGKQRNEHKESKGGGAEAGRSFHRFVALSVVRMTISIYNRFRKISTKKTAQLYRTALFKPKTKFMK